jgi:uncharacterized protein (UPF0128 family)
MYCSIIYYFVSLNSVFKINVMAITVKKEDKETLLKAGLKSEKISKLAKAIKKGSLKDVVIELVDDPWDLKPTAK